MAVEAEQAVGRGGDSADEVADWLIIVCDADEYPGVDDDTRAAVARAAVRRAIDRQVQTQISWPEKTDCDRLAEAFEVLASNGIVTSAGESCCSNCAHSELVEEALERDGAHGYAFYHSQDLGGVTPGGSSGLMIGFGHISPELDDCRLVGTQVIDALVEAGFEVVWDGNPEHRVRLVNLVWQQRWCEAVSDSPIDPEIAKVFDEIGDQQIAQERARLALGVDPDISEIEERATAGEPHDSDAMNRLGVLAYKAGDMVLAESWWQKATDLGDSTAMWRLGGLAEDAGNLELAESWFQKSADLGDSDALDSLGVLAYTAGDLELAESWWQKSADLGNSDGMLRLGWLAQQAGGRKAAESWYQKAADLGHLGAMYNLGRLAYEAGDSVLAESWWQKAAELGVSDAMNDLGRLADKEGDLGLAKSWYQKATDLGDTNGMWGLGNLAYAAGDMALAESWWQKAADLSNAYGMASLGMLADNAGDFVLAESWYQKAADGGNQFAIDELARLAAS